MASGKRTPSAVLSSTALVTAVVTAAISFVNKDYVTATGILAAALSSLSSALRRQPRGLE